MIAVGTKRRRFEKNSRSKRLLSRKKKNKKRVVFGYDENLMKFDENKNSLKRREEERGGLSRFLVLKET